jgi:hypothetical protein
MNSETRLQQKRLDKRLASRQQTFEFSSCELWRRLPCEDQQACLQALASLLCQVIAQAPRDPQDLGEPQ